MRSFILIVGFLVVQQVSFAQVDTTSGTLKIRKPLDVVEVVPGVLLRVIIARVGVEWERLQWDNRLSPGLPESNSVKLGDRQYNAICVSYEWNNNWRVVNAKVMNAGLPVYNEIALEYVGKMLPVDQPGCEANTTYIIPVWFYRNNLGMR